MTDVFGGDLKSAFRSASIIDDAWLEIIDELSTDGTRPAHVRFTLISKVRPQIGQNGILFNDGKTRMILSTDADGAKYMIWSSNPKDYGSPTAFGEPAFKKTWICGYEYDIPAGTAVKVSTTMKRK